MSLDSPWLGAIVAIFVPALGHLYHFILSCEYHQRLGAARDRPDAVAAGAAGDFWRVLGLAPRQPPEPAMVELGLAVASLRLALPDLRRVDMAGRIAAPGNAPAASRSCRPVRSTRPEGAARRRQHDRHRERKLAAAIAGQRVVAALAQGVGAASSAIAPGT